MEAGNPDKEKIFQKLKNNSLEVISMFFKSYAYMRMLMRGTFLASVSRQRRRTGTAVFRDAAAVFYLLSAEVFFLHKF